MARETLSKEMLFVEDVTNLDAVTSATDGIAVDTRWYKDKTIFITVSGNSGAVTVNIEASHDGTDWFGVATKTYAASTNTVDIYSYTSYFPYMRTTTTTQGTSTVSTVITGRS
ncbi:unnamed protein product [marine sediment metagenome]|uniref:F5/8 type C domain-containing protein n=1 Tax=marine sediment metagenome TaxID=412755 RepID=X1A059_9ZZZZ